jgi:molybdate transport system permease protein
MENILSKNKSIAINSIEIPVKKRFDTFKLLAIIINTSIITFIISIVVSMFLKVNLTSMVKVLSSIETYSAFKITLTSIFVSMPMVIVIGTILAYTLSNKVGFIYKIFEIIVCMPVILPPSVAGIALLSALGRNGLIGKVINNYGINTTFNFFSIVIVQVFITLPLYYQIVKASFDNIEKSIIESAKVFGANSFNLILKIYIPISIKGILAGIILSSLRAISEFGATIMFAGNMVNKTQTVTTRIYHLYQTDITAAISLALLQIMIFIIPFIFVKIKLKY